MKIVFRMFFLSLIISTPVFYFVVGEYYDSEHERKRLYFTDFVSTLEASKQKLILLSLLAETEIHLPVFSKSENDGKLVYIYSYDNKEELTDEELVIFRIMQLSARYLPKLFYQDNSMYYYRSYQTDKVFYYNEFDESSSILKVPNIYNCSLHESCSKYSTNEQLEDRVLFSMFYEHDVNEVTMISISSPVTNQATGEIIGEFVIDTPITNRMSNHFDYISYVDGNDKTNAIIESSIIDSYDEESYQIDNFTTFKYKMSKANRYFEYYWAFMVVFFVVFFIGYKWVKLFKKDKELTIVKTDMLLDELTGLHNRKLLSDSEFLQALTKQRTCIIAFDGNKIKRINDQLGHAYGDEAIKSIADSLKKVFRESDYLFRIGGDEFLAILPNCELSKAHDLIIKSKQEVSKNTIENITLSISAGTVELESFETLDKAISRADDELYLDKFKSRSNSL